MRGLILNKNSLENTVIALTITDFEMFPNQDKVISHLLLTEADYLIDYLIYNIELLFVELPKFNKELEELETLTDKWIYFIKSVSRLESVPETMGVVPEIQRAFEIANQANLTRAELEDLEKREIWIHDQRNAIKRAVKQNKIEIARRLLDVLDEQTISETTGLSLEEVRELKHD